MSTSITLTLDGQNLDPITVFKIASAPADKYKIEIHPTNWEKIKASREYVDKIVNSDKVVYGINTGFGALSSKVIPKDKLTDLQYNLIRSHCVGVGRSFDRDMTRAIMLVRLNCLIQGHSGTSPEILQLLLDFLHHDINPCIPEKGSVGASGDLAPLSHLALALIGEGDVFYQHRKINSTEAMQKVGLKPVSLRAKDGLSLINGTSVMAAIACVGIYRTRQLLKLNDICSSLTLEALRGTKSAMDLDIALLKPHAGQMEVCKNINKILTHSEIMDSHVDCDRVQDPYSLRCIPQVHGAVREVVNHVEKLTKTEINSVTDNPLIFVEKDKVISGGNFHGEAIAFAMDYLCMGLSELSNISERRVEKLMNPEFSHLPAFLTKDSGLNSGLMIAQVTMAALASQNKIYANPAVTDSIPTSTDKEDHVSMGLNSGLKLLEIKENLVDSTSIELLCGYQGIKLLAPLKTTPALQPIIDKFDKEIGVIKEDRVFAYDFKKIRRMILKEEIIPLVEEHTGTLF